VGKPHRRSDDGFQDEERRNRTRRRRARLQIQDQRPILTVSVWISGVANGEPSLGRDYPNNGDCVDSELSELAQEMEDHELAVWTQCVDAVAALPGNPLDAVIDRSGPVPLVALRAVDRGDFNRVIGLGVRQPARPEDLERIRSFYQGHQQRNFWVEVTPLSRPSEMPEWLTAHAMDSEGPPQTFKMWRRVENPPEMPRDIEVRRLGSDDAEALIAVNIAAWGAWSTPVSMASWFGATVGSAEVKHYGVFDGERLVATGALFIRDSLGWLGFDATHPRYQGRKLRQAISSVRMEDAAGRGCQIVHAESTVRPSWRAIGDGWHLLYEKRNYASVPVGAEAAVTGGGATDRDGADDTPANHPKRRSRR